MRKIEILSIIIMLLLSGCSSPFLPEKDLGNLPGNIYFTSSRTGDCEIYVMNPDGTDIKNFTNSRDTDDWLCTVSSNGERIAFTRGTFRNFDSFEIWIMDSDGSNWKQLTHNDKADGHSDFSPDGKKIVFASWRDGNEEIYIMNVDGSNQRRLTNNPTNDNDPDWSPDGSRIAFKSIRAYSNESSDEMLDSDYEIFVMDTTGENIVRLTNDRYSDHDPDWSPNGQKIAFLRYIEGRGSNVWVMSSDGSNQTNLTNTGDSWYTSWLEDGSKIAFCSTRSGNTDIWIMNSDGSNPLQVTYSYFTDEYPAWR